MYISVNERNEIKKVGIDENLTTLYIKDEENPFVGWSEAKICCYKVNVVDGIVMMMTPYVDSRLIDHIDQLGKQTESITPYSATKKAYIDDTEVIFESDRKGVITCSAISDSGISIPTTFYVEGNKVIVAFMPLEEVATVSINIQ